MSNPGVYCRLIATLMNFRCFSFSIPIFTKSKESKRKRRWWLFVLIVSYPDIDWWRRVNLRSHCFLSDKLSHVQKVLKMYEVYKRFQEAQKHNMIRKLVLWREMKQTKKYFFFKFVIFIELDSVTHQTGLSCYCPMPTQLGNDLQQLVLDSMFNFFFFVLKKTFGVIELTFCIIINENESNPLSSFIWVEPFRQGSGREGIFFLGSGKELMHFLYGIGNNVCREKGFYNFFF